LSILREAQIFRDDCEAPPPSSFAIIPIAPLAQHWALDPHMKKRQQ
jgi:hypothetical protein